MKPKRRDMQSVYNGHSAVDEESPGSSSKKLTLSPASATESGLEVQLKSPKGTAFPQHRTEACQRTSKFEAQRAPLTSRCGTQSPFGKPVESTLEKSAFETCVKYELKESTNPATIKINSTTDVRVAEDSTKIPSSPEDTSDIEIQEVRKDSALFLEEAEGVPALREILKSRAPKIVRPRRESSGYASNLGTFDEGDRRNSDALQDPPTFLKERRRSSTKRPNSKIENLDISSTDRMPTTEVHRKISSAGLEMPNIEEVKEFLKDDLCTGVDDVGDSLARCHLSKEKTTQKAFPEESQVPQNVEIFGKSRTTASTRPQGASDASSLTDSTDTFQRNSSQPATKPKKTIRRMIHQSSTVISATSVDIDTIEESFTEKLPNNVFEHAVQPESEAESSEILMQCYPDGRKVESQRKQMEDVALSADTKLIPRSTRMYQLLSTQSEDRSEGDLKLTDRRISLQISEQEAKALRDAKTGESTEDTASTSKDLIAGESQDGRSAKDTLAGSPIRKLSSPGEVGSGQRFLGDVGNVTVRPIYPYCPYSPYGSPQGSPRNRRRPMRESRRVSIDNRQGALQLNQYKLLDNIGQGSYGIVKLAYNEEDETHYAMKILSKKKLMKKAGIFGRMAPGRKGAANPLAKVYREIALLKKLDHPNVVKLVEVLDDPDEDNLYLVFELVQRGEVLQIPTDKPLNEETARKNFRDVVMGVEYLHYQRIVHRDIKPSNLLVDSEGRIKIADLGVSAELRASGELLSGPAGTPAFAAPETTTPGAHYSGTLCDIWSMGVTLYSLVTGRVPWDGAGSIIGVQAAVRSEPLRFPEKPALSESLENMISRMLAKDPSERITLSEMKEHVWLTNRGADPLPSEADNCRLPVTVTDEEIERVVTRVPKLDTLILIKTMLKQHSFQNPFLPKRISRTTCSDSDSSNLELSAVGRTNELEQREAARNVKTERFHRAGRSNSAPDSYDWQMNGRQISVDSPLPPVTEATNQESEVEKR